jgi:hypothetical protein
MGCCGLHFALTDDEVTTFRALPTDEERVDYVTNEIEEKLFGTIRGVETDKAWDAIHRALSDGHLTWDGGTHPLNAVILAGSEVYNTGDFIMSLKSPAVVRDVAASLVTLSEQAFHEGYARIDATSYQGKLGPEDMEYSWYWLQNTLPFWKAAAKANHWVLFSADQ